MVYAITKNAEIPERGRGPKQCSKYPFDRMEVGDGFDVPPTSPPTAAPSVVAGRVRSAARQWSKRGGVGSAFTVHQLAGGAVRCVRIA